MSAASHRYVYYRVGHADLEAALQAVRRLQHRWRDCLPGLVTELYVRDEGHGADGRATVMEVWRWTGGGEAAPLPPWETIEEDLFGAVGRWLDGPRKVERFRCA